MLPSRVLVALAALSTVAAQPPVFNVRSYGARGDGVSNDTLSVQRAFDAATQLQGACVVLFPAGSYLSWPLQLLNAVNTTLQWAADAVLIAPQMEAWPAAALRPYGGAYLTVQGGSGLTLVGAGQGAAAINGNGRAWWEAFRRDASVVRPQPLLNLVGISDLVVRDLQVTLAPMFHIILSHCQRALLEDVGVLSDAGSPNTDGIDPSASSDVTIRRAHISNGDDCVAVKDRCARVLVEDTTCENSHGLSIGSLGEHGSTAAVEDVLFRNCTLFNTLGAAKIKAWQGGKGFARNITWLNVNVTGAATPIQVTQFYCPGDAAGCNPQPGGVTISDVTVSDFRATQTNGWAAVFNCTHDAPCSGITLSDVYITPVAGVNRNAVLCEHATGTATDVSPASCLAARTTAVHLPA